MKKLILVSCMFALGIGSSMALANPPHNPPGQDPCSHGNSGKPCRPDPQPDHGKDCQHHGNNGGVNEDHCGPVSPPVTTTAPGASQTTTQATTTAQTTTAPPTTPSTPTVTTTQTVTVTPQVPPITITLPSGVPVVVNQPVTVNVAAPNTPPIYVVVNVSAPPSCACVPVAKPKAKPKPCPKAAPKKSKAHKVVHPKPKPKVKKHYSCAKYGKNWKMWHGKCHPIVRGNG